MNRKAAVRKKDKLLAGSFFEFVTGVNLDTAAKKFAEKEARKSDNTGTVAASPPEVVMQQAPKSIAGPPPPPLPAQTQQQPIGYYPYPFPVHAQQYPFYPEPCYRGDIQSPPAPWAPFLPSIFPPQVPPYTGPNGPLGPQEYGPKPSPATEHGVSSSSDEDEEEEDDSEDSATPAMHGAVPVGVVYEADRDDATSVSSQQYAACHMCSSCGRRRSRGYHSLHPIIPGEPAPREPCRRCSRRKKRESSRSSGCTMIQGEPLQRIVELDEGGEHKPEKQSGVDDKEEQAQAPRGRTQSRRESLAVSDHGKAPSTNRSRKASQKSRREGSRHTALRSSTPASQQERLDYRHVKPNIQELETVQTRHSRQEDLCYRHIKAPKHVSPRQLISHTERSAIGMDERDEAPLRTAPATPRKVSSATQNETKQHITSIFDGAEPVESHEGKKPDRMSQKASSAGEKIRQLGSDIEIPRTRMYSDAEPRILVSCRYVSPRRNLSSAHRRMAEDPERAIYRAQKEGETGKAEREADEASRHRQDILRRPSDSSRFRTPSNRKMRQEDSWESTKAERGGYHVEFTKTERRYSPMTPVATPGSELEPAPTKAERRTGKERRRQERRQHSSQEVILDTNSKKPHLSAPGTQATASSFTQAAADLILYPIDKCRSLAGAAKKIYEVPTSWEERDQQPSPSEAKRAPSAKREIIVIRRSPSPTPSRHSARSKKDQPLSEAPVEGYKTYSEYHERPATPPPQSPPAAEVPPPSPAPMPPFAATPDWSWPAESLKAESVGTAFKAPSRHDTEPQPPKAPSNAGSFKLDVANGFLAPPSDPGLRKSYSERALASQSREDLKKDAKRLDGNDDHETEKPWWENPDSDDGGPDNETKTFVDVTEEIEQRSDGRKQRYLRVEETVQLPSKDDAEPETPGDKTGGSPGKKMTAKQARKAKREKKRASKAAKAGRVIDV